MKSTIQAEAEKAAKKIREALEGFNRVTGFEMTASAQWATTSVVHDKDHAFVRLIKSPQVVCKVAELEVKA